MADELIRMAGVRDDIVVLTADLASSNGLGIFCDAFSQRFENTGTTAQTGQPNFDRLYRARDWDEEIPGE